MKQINKKKATILTLIIFLLLSICFTMLSFSYFYFIAFFIFSMTILTLMVQFTLNKKTSILFSQHQNLIYKKIVYKTMLIENNKKIAQVYGLYLSIPRHGKIVQQGIEKK